MDEKRYYTTVSGDMWDSIAYIGLLMDNTPHLLDISVFSDGTPVYIPELPEESDEDLPEWRV